MTEKTIYPGIEKRVKEPSSGEDKPELIVEKLRQSEEQFRNLFEGSVQGILIHRDHKPLFVNEKWSRIHGYSSEEVLRMNTIVGLISQKDQKRMIEYKEARLQGKHAPEDYEYQAVHKDGILIWLDNRVSVIKWKGHEAILTTIFDITRRKKAEADREKLISELQNAVEKIKTLEGIVPICSHCKSIRDDKGYWNRLEHFIEEHSEAQFSHSICDKCLDEFYLEEDEI